MIDTLPLPGLQFELPPELEASAPPEARQIARDDVRLLVSQVADNRMEHVRFRDLPRALRAGDVLVINTSATVPAALHARRADGSSLELHLSTHLPADLWVVEVRTPGPAASTPFRAGQAGETLTLPGGATATLLAPYSRDRTQPMVAPRLWLATVQVPGPLLQYLDEHGFPIRYIYVPQQWPISYYQTVFANEPGSAEMPSAGRAFTAELVAQLVAMGVQFAPLLLHTGVSSLEDHEPPYEEFFRVPAVTAQLVNTARADGRRVIAVGTTAVRALESATDERGVVAPAQGWTDLVITPERGVRAVDGLLTGLHEPRSSHLAMLEALAGRAHLRHAYNETLRERYLWHEFGDMHLIVP